MKQRINHPVELEYIKEILENDEYTGFCINCGGEIDCCEHDVREADCDYCERKTVYGAGEILINGWVK